MDKTYLIIITLIAVVLIRIIYKDIQTGEYSFIRFILELFLLYGIIGLTFYLTLTFLIENVFLVFIINSLAVVYGLTCRQRIIDFTEKILPPKYKNMNTDEAVKHLKKYNSSPQQIATFLIKERGMKSEEVVRIITKNFTKDELKSDL